MPQCHFGDMFINKMCHYFFYVISKFIEKTLKNYTSQFTLHYLPIRSHLLPFGQSYHGVSMLVNIFYHTRWILRYCPADSNLCTQNEQIMLVLALLSRWAATIRSFNRAITYSATGLNRLPSALF